MNKIMKFRGQCISPKYEDECMYLKMIVGDLKEEYGDYFIKYEGEWYKVKKDTISIYTGINNCFQGDILKRINTKNNKPSFEKSFGVIQKEKETNNLIFKWYNYNEFLNKFNDVEILPLKSIKYYANVGNIYENKKLLCNINIEDDN